MVLRAGFDTPAAAKYAKIELYRLRTKAKRQSKRGLDPDDPGYDTSPWDNFKIEQPGADRNGLGGSAELRFFVTGHGTYSYTILDPEIEAVAVPKPVRPRKKKPSS